MGNFQNFGLPDGAGDPELDEILPFMTNVMQKLLSKDLLYPVLTDIVDRVSSVYYFLKIIVAVGK